MLTEGLFDVESRVAERLKKRISIQHNVNPRTQTQTQT